MARVKSAVVPVSEQRIVKQQLDFAGPVAQLGEQHAAVVADAQHPPGHGHRAGALGIDRLCDGVARRLADGIGVDAAVLQRLEFGHPHPDLLGQPRLLVLGQIGLQLADDRGRCRRGAAARSPPGFRAPRCGGRCAAVRCAAKTAAPESLRRSPRRRRRGGPAGRPRSRRSAAPIRVGTSCSTGTASPAATSARRTPAGRATAARPGPRRAGRPARTPTGTSRSSARSGSRRCLRTACTAR